MSTRANDQNIIFFCEWRILPESRPVAMMAKRMPGKAEDGKPTH
jgi:hypothetical protein